MADYASRVFAGAGRDIVLVDPRGTGRSNPLQCEFRGGMFGDLLPPEDLARCRQKLEKSADLTQYTTARIVEDLEEVRRRLGYEKVNLYGTSYGTRVAQEYMQRYPKSIRTVILDGIVPPWLVMPATYAQDAERSLRAVFALCRARPAARPFPTSRRTTRRC